MDIKDMIVKKRLASLNASAIMSASYAQERPKDAQGKSGYDNNNIERSM